MSSTRLIVEYELEGALQKATSIDMGHVLLSEIELEAIVVTLVLAGKITDTDVIIRREYDTEFGYYKNEDSEWCYGSLRDAERIIKQRKENGKRVDA